MEETKSFNSNNPVFSKSILEMITVANDYCLFIEKSADYSRDELLNYLQKICPLIYLKAALLPDIDVEDEDAVEHFVNEEQWEGLFTVLRGKLAADDSYYFIDHHEKTHQDAVKASLAENITDIYQDLKDFLLLYLKPLTTSKENAVRDCKRLFETRFGYRLVNAHTAIHYLLFTEGEKGEFSDLFL
ncbi:MAG: DUF5063 domain-containing protein [Bacteroidetes bacterium]|nr:DUF5063 domain-containing protein [Bacteroidota bacterium]